MTPRVLRARAELFRLLETGPAPFPLDRAALLLAMEEYPELDPAPYEARLAAYAERVARAAGPGEEDPRRRLAALRRVLFEEEGFQGNREAYYDLRNSYLNEVLDRKLGIPLTLGIVMLGVARRLGWPLFPVNFPNHFLVLYPAADEPLPVDPFHGGLILSREDLEERWRFGTGYDPPAPERMLAVASPRAVLVRMLNNIRTIHAQHRRYARAARVTELISQLEPENAVHERDLGYLLLAARDLEGALYHLDRYLARRPRGADARRVREQMLALRSRRLGR